MADSTRDMRRSVYERELKPKFSNQKLAEITHEDLRALTDATGGAALAGKAVMRRYGWCVRRPSGISEGIAASMSSGGDMPSMGSITGGNSGGDGGNGGGAGRADSTPFAQASGFGGSGSSSSGGGFAKAAKLATGTASELAKGIGSQMK